MRLLVRLTVVQTLDQVELWFRCTPRMRLPFRLIFGQPLCQIDLWADVSSQDEASIQVNIWSAFVSD